MKARLLNEKFQESGDPIKQLKIKWTPEQYIRSLIKNSNLKNVTEDDFFEDLGEIIYNYMEQEDLVEAWIDTIDHTPLDYQKGFYDSWFEVWKDKQEDDEEDDDE